MFSGSAFGELAFCEQDHVAGDDSAFQTFLRQVSAPRCWLLEIDALSLAVSDALSSGFGEAAFGEAAFSGDDAGGTGGVQTLRYSSHGWTRRDYGYAEYLLLPASALNYASTPDSVLNSVTGDCSLVADITPDDYTPSAAGYFMAKYANPANRSQAFFLTTAGKLSYSWLVSVPTVITVESTVAYTSDLGRFVRVDHDVNNGAGGNTVTFYTSHDEITWTQLGSAVVTVGTTSVSNSSASWEFGSFASGVSGLFAGKLRKAKVYSGIMGTPVLVFDPRTDARPGSTSFTSSTTGEVYTVHQFGATPARLVAGGEAAYFYEGRLTGDFTVDRSIVGRGGIGGLSRVFSEIVLLNNDGGLDALQRDYAIDGRAIRLLVGDEGAEYESFGVVFEGEIESASVTERELRLRCTDGLSRLALPIQTTNYAGSGGNEGGADLAGKPKPLCYGEALNITPPLVDAANLIYQVHDGAITDVTAVRDRGVALTKVVGVPGAGEYSVDAANGRFTLGTSPDGEVTCDVQGDTPTAGYSANTGVIVQRILATRLATSDIDTTAFANLFSALSAVVGIWIGTEIRLTTDVLDELLAGAGTFGGFTRQGVFTIGQVSAASGAPVLELDETSILSIEREPLPVGLEPVAWRVQVGWGKNYTVQTDIAALAADADRTFASEPLRVATAEDSAIRSQHLLARDYGPVPALYRDEADAEAEADRLFDLWGVRRAQYRVSVPIEGMLADLGQVVELTHPRHLLSLGAAGRVISQSIRGSKVELRVIV